MPNHKYRVIYFNGRGRAELTRLVLAQAGVPYEDSRLSGMEWAQLKATGVAPFGQMPLLQIDGYTLAQARAMTNFIAREHGLKGKTSLETAQIDMISDALEDMTKAMLRFQFEDNPIKREEYSKEASENVIPRVLEGLEKLLVANNGGDGFLVGSEVTLADIQFFCVMGDIHFFGSYGGFAHPLSNYKKLEALKNRVESLPRIAEWLKKRPKTSF